MTDDLVKRLRDGDYTIKMRDGEIQYLNHAAADRIEKLEEALKQIAFDWHSEDTFIELDVCINVARSALREKKDD